MNQTKINRINELSSLARQRALTALEQAERAALRREYTDAIKASLSAHLDNTILVDEAGNKRKLPRKE